MRELHPEIKNFWESNDKLTYHVGGTDTIYYARNTLVAILSNDKSESDDYYLTGDIDESPKTEEEILKLIKLKAFL